MINYKEFKEAFNACKTDGDFRKLVLSLNGSDINYLKNMLEEFRNYFSLSLSVEQEKFLSLLTLKHSLNSRRRC